MNLTTFRVWCYACEKEVFLEPRLAAHPPGPAPKFSEQVRGRRGQLAANGGRGQWVPDDVCSRSKFPGGAEAQVS